MSEASVAIESADDMTARHRKELKVLDGEKRAALKKTKTTAGKSKKAKEMLAAVETEYDEKLKQMEARHREELASAIAIGAAKLSLEANAVAGVAVADDEINEGDDDGGGEDDTEEQRQRVKKLEKARKKREKQRVAERQKEEQIAAETAAAGPSRRHVELQQILARLDDLDDNDDEKQYTVQEITADGHCLYRAVAAAHLGSAERYLEIRNLCADALIHHEADFAPFCEYNNNNNSSTAEEENGGKAADFAAYVDRVRNSSTWGGHLELRAIATAIGRSVVVYSAQEQQQQQAPITIEPISSTTTPPTTDAVAEPIRLSYHLHYYSLGEHYNLVVPVASTGGDENS